MSGAQQSIDQYSLVAFLPLGLVALAVGWIVSRWWRARRSLVLLVCLSVAAIVAITLVGRMLELSAWGYRGVDLGWLADFTSWSQLHRLDRGSLLNLLLFVPAGAFLTASTRRLGLSVGLLAVLALAIEVVQRTWGLGAADPRDILANTAGALVGGIAGLLASGEVLVRRADGSPSAPRA